MSGAEFYQTRMGQTFYEHHVPKIAMALESIAQTQTVLAEHLTQAKIQQEKALIDDFVEFATSEGNENTDLPIAAEVFFSSRE